MQQLNLPQESLLPVMLPRDALRPFGSPNVAVMGFRITL